MKTIIVTGCNKGIGHGIVGELMKSEKAFKIIMACRNQDLAFKAQQDFLS